MRKTTLRLAYRSQGHYPLLHAMCETDLAARYGFEVDLHLLEDRERARDLLLDGTYPVLSGNHHNVYRLRQQGFPFVHVAQSINVCLERIVTRAPVSSLHALRGKRLGVGKLEGHPELNSWLYFKREGVDTTRELERVEILGDEERLAALIAGTVDVAHLSAPYDLYAQRAGLTALSLPPLPMISRVTLTTTSTYVREHPEVIRGLVTLLAAGIHAYLTERARMVEWIGETFKLPDDEAARHLYEEIVPGLERRPYPTLEAIQNVFAIARRKHPQVDGMNPLLLWDLHHLRELDESGFIKQLYR